MINIQLERIEDPVIRESFQKIVEAFRTNPLLSSSWRLYELEFEAANPLEEIIHNLPFKPENCLLLFVEGNVNFYFRHDLFDNTKIVANVGGPCRVRFIAGRLAT